MTRIPVSIRFDFYRKWLRTSGLTPASKEQQTQWEELAGGKSAYGWTVREMTMQELADHVTTGNAISVGIFKRGHRSRSDRTGGWILGLDFEISKSAKERGLTSADGLPVEKIIQDEFLHPFIGVAAPTSSDSPEDPRARVLIPLSRSVTPTEYRDIALVFIARFSDYIGIGESKDASRYYYGSVPNPARVYVNNDAVLDVDAFLVNNPVEGTGSGDDTPKERRQRADNYVNTPEGDARLAEHFAQPQDKQETLVKETLDWVLKAHDPKTWSREDWLQVAFAAWHGSSGSSRIRDYIVTHPYAPKWKRGADEFMQGWDEHVHQEGGVTFASLQWLAKQVGWLTESGLEIPEQLVKKINVRYVQQWLEELKELPTRVLLQSQTGSGKTHALKYLWERLGKPKTVVFVPSVKLAMELAGTLKNIHGVPATLYIQPSTGKRLGTAELLKADFLITTLQTFSTKVSAKGYSMDRYGLVYVEESDQLFQHFSRGGEGFYGSHVSDRETRAGFDCLRDAFENSGNVWCVDATMTMVTYHMADNLRGENRLRVIRNEWIEKKPAVTMLQSREQAFQIVLRSLEQKKTVVVACDTASAASDIVKTMEALHAIRESDYLLITRDTERDPRVSEFLSNVNKYASQYRLVAYNSVMASGVSVTGVKPDVIVQIGNYLTPRVNLQLLNRYRRQHDVYCFYQSTENLYVETQRSIMDEVKKRAEVEAQIVNIPVAERTSNANLRFDVAAISIADIAAQSRSTSNFYVGLLRSDGREVVFSEGFPTASVIKSTLRGVREAKKERRQYIAENWKTVDPVDYDRPAPPHYNDLQVAMGHVHAEIEGLLNGNIPQDVPAEEIHKIVMGFKTTTPALNAFMHQKAAVAEAENYLSDSGRALTSIYNNVTLVKVLSLLKLLYADIHEGLTQADVERRGEVFLKTLYKERETYDSIIFRDRDKYAEVLKRSEDPIEQTLAFSKIILARVGLKQRSQRVKHDEREYSIANADDLITYLTWRDPDDPPMVRFNMAGVEAAIEDKSDVMKIYIAMNERDRARAIKLIDTERYTDFTTAVWSVYSGLDKF